MTKTNENEIKTLINRVNQAGIYEVEFNALSVNWDLASGIYFYQLKAGIFSETKQMILLK